MFEDGVYFDSRVRQFLSQLGTLIHSLADDVGLVEESKLVSELPCEDWQQILALVACPSRATQSVWDAQHSKKYESEDESSSGLDWVPGNPHGDRSAMRG